MRIISDGGVYLIQFYVIVIKTPIYRWCFFMSKYQQINVKKCILDNATPKHLFTFII